MSDVQVPASKAPASGEAAGEISCYYRLSVFDPTMNGVMTATLSGKATGVHDALDRLGKMLSQFPQEHIEGGAFSLTPFEDHDDDDAPQAGNAAGVPPTSPKKDGEK